MRQEKASFLIEYSFHAFLHGYAIVMLTEPYTRRETMIIHYYQVLPDVGVTFDVRGDAVEAYTYVNASI